jgi:hypothetical protein
LAAKKYAIKRHWHPIHSLYIMTYKTLFLPGLLLPLFLFCGRPAKPVKAAGTVAADTPVLPANTGARLVHVYVALCDNKYQGIVPVPPRIGNGQDPANNLYWGCDYGIKTYFKKYAGWKLLQSWQRPTGPVLERCLFKHPSQELYLLADAYDGAAIKQCTIDFLTAAAGRRADSARYNGKTLYAGSSAPLVAYIGHNGLMDFKMDSLPTQLGSNKREAIILACISKSYFKKPLQTAGASPLVWTTGLMCPEAYTLEAAISGWSKKETPAQVRQRAAAAYSKYQHCSVKAAANLLVTGW